MINEEIKTINASEIKPDDEWMQETEWDEIYSRDGEYLRIYKGDVSDGK